MISQIIHSLPDFFMKTIRVFGNTRAIITKSESDLNMKHSDKSLMSQSVDKQIYGMDFHDFIVKEPNNSMVELASEFGLTVRDIRNLKKQIERS